MLKIFFFTFAFLVTSAGVELYRRVALKRGYYDVPNARSLHRLPIPRGGGIIIAAVSLIFYWLYFSAAGAAVSWSYSLSILAIAGISFYDDVSSVPIVKRIVVHSIGAILVIWQYGYWNEIYFPLAGEINLGLIGLPLTFLWFVWMTNAYNFMDGIDGLAALQAFAGGLTWLAAGVLLGSRTAVCLGGLTASCGLGFFVHNRSPARIFMGDVGSTFLGFTFAALPLLVKNEIGANTQILPFTALMVMWFFVFDTVITFGRRVLKSRKFWEAHREHLYQKLVEKGLSHNFVTVVYCLLSGSIQIILLLGLIKNINFLAISLGLALALSTIIFIFEKKYTGDFAFN